MNQFNYFGALYEVAVAAGILDQWTTLTPLPVARGTFPACGAINGKVYVVGGTQNGDNLMNTNYEYDIALNTWSLKAALPYGIRETQASVVDGKLYVMSGYEGYNSYNYKNYRYDPTANSWAAMANVPFHYRDGACFSIGNYIYATLGFVNFSGITTQRSLYEYSVSENTWTTKASTIINQTYSMACTCNNKGYVVSAEGFTEYNKALNSWASISLAGFDAVYARLSNAYNKVYLFAFATQTTKEYNPSNNTWATKTANELVNNYGSGVCTWNDTIYVMGGGNSIVNCYSYK